MHNFSDLFEQVGALLQNERDVRQRAEGHERDLSVALFQRTDDKGDRVVAVIFGRIVFFRVRVRLFAVIERAAVHALAHERLRFARVHGHFAEPAAFKSDFAIFAR